MVCLSICPSVCSCSSFWKHWHWHFRFTSTSSEYLGQGHTRLLGQVKSHRRSLLKTVAKQWVARLDYQRLTFGEHPNHCCSSCDTHGAIIQVIAMCIFASRRIASQYFTHIPYHTVFPLTDAADLKYTPDI